jgi:phage/plasmid-associated DNA primase
MTNHAPKINVDDNGVVDRDLMIWWRARFTSQPVGTELPKDPAFVESLFTQAGLNDLFTWMVKGAVEFYTAGRKIAKPLSLESAHADYFAELDVVQQFLEQRCEVGDAAYRVEQKVVFNAFTNWAGVEQRSRYDTPARLYTSLAQKGFVKKKSSGKRLFAGLRLQGALQGGGDATMH